jgi:hypothetical protein
LPLILAPAAFAWLLARGAPKDNVAMDRRAAAAVALLFGGALFAYMAVGKGAPLFVLNLPWKWLGASSFLGRETDQWFFTTVDGWSTRHAFLFSVPAAIATVGLVRWVSARADASVAQRSWTGAIALAVVLGLGWMTYGHAAKLTRLGQEQAIVDGLRTLPPPPPGRVDLRLTPHPSWSVWTYEANYWMWQAWRQSVWATAAYPRPDQPGVTPETEPALKDREAAVAADNLRDYNVMSEFERQSCRTILQVRIPDGIGALALPAASLGIGSVPAAKVEETSRICS